MLVESLNQIHGLRCSLHELGGGTKPLFLPFVRDSLSRESFRHRQFVKQDRTARQLCDNFRNGEGLIKKILAGLKSVPGTAIKEVDESAVIVPDDFFFVK